MEQREVLTVHALSVLSWRYMYSDWSRTTLYLAIITLHKAILAGVLDFKMAALHFFNNSAEVILTIEVN